MKIRHLRQLIKSPAGIALISGALIASSVLPGPVALAQATVNWQRTGSMHMNRFGHTATLLPNGRVLVFGGTTSAGSPPRYQQSNSAELYDPVTGTWSYTGELNVARIFASGTLLQNGKVLVAGGRNVVNLSSVTSLNSAELYDPATGQWQVTGSFNLISDFHDAVLLSNGKVLAVGSDYSAELYDPATGAWTSLNPPSGLGPQRGPITLLDNGKVLILGGHYYPSVIAAELYDPATGASSVAGSLNLICSADTATLLSNGTVLVIGGTGFTLVAEVYDPASGAWRVTGQPATQTSGAATLLSDGRVLLTPEYSEYNSPAPADGEEIYDPANGKWTRVAPPYSDRASLFSAVRLSNGKVLICGGWDGNYDWLPTIFDSAELFTPSAISPFNPLDDTQFFVRQQYRDFLNREPDPEGFDFWTKEITSCGDDATCLEIKRINTSAAYFLSVESQETGYEVYRLYQAAYGNRVDAPVPVKFEEFLPDTRAIGQGVIVKQLGWQQVLENNKHNFVANFVERARFATAFPAIMSGDVFVDTLNHNAGNALSQTERDHLVSDLSTGTQSRADVLRTVAEHPNLVQAEFNRAFVLMQYFGYLRRDPNQGPDADFSGYNFWLSKLNQFNGDFLQAEMVKAFIDSDEYRKRFGS